MPSRLAFLLELLLDRLELLLDIIDAGLELLAGLALLGQVLPSPGQVLPQRGSLISLRMFILAILKPIIVLLKFLNLARDLSAKGIHRGPVIGGLARFPFETLTFLKSGYFFLGILDVATDLGIEGLTLGLTVGSASCTIETLLLHPLAHILQAIVNLTNLVLNGVPGDGVGGTATGDRLLLVLPGDIRPMTVGIGRKCAGLVLAVTVGVVAGSAEAEASRGAVVGGHDSMSKDIGIIPSSGEHVVREEEVEECQSLRESKSITFR